MSAAVTKLRDWAPPARGTVERLWWERGAEAETYCRTTGRSKDGIEVRDYVDALAEFHHSYDRTAIASAVAYVFTNGLRARWALAWRLIRPRPRYWRARRWLRRVMEVNEP